MKLTKAIFLQRLLLSLVLLVSGQLHATEMTVNGFIAQGVIQASDSSYVNDAGESSGKLTEVGLNTSLSFSPAFRVAAQAVYLNGGNRYEEGVRLDYLFADWLAYSELDWQLNVYLGRFKNQHWLYSSTRDVPMTRSSVVLPQSVYFDGFRDIAVASDGIALKLGHVNDTGEYELNWSWGKSPISKKQSQIMLSRLAQGDVEQDFVHQMSLFYQPALSAWRLGLSLLDSDFSYQQGQQDLFYDGLMQIQRVMLNGIYSGERWEFASEVFSERLRIEDFYFPTFDNSQTGIGWYLQAQYKLSDRVKVMARIDDFVADKDDRDGEKLALLSQGLTPAYFGFQQDVTLGVSYEISQNLRVSAEFHQIDGAARTAPVLVRNTELNQRDWQIWAAQLMYWF